MAFVLIGKEATRKVIIDYRDQSDVIEDALLWSDIYAKINVDAGTRQHPFSHKIINIPPSFAISIWNPAELLYQMCNNFLRAKIIKHFGSKNIHLKPKRWIRSYLSLLKRQTLKQYTIQKQSQNSNYVFFVSTLWADQSSTNMKRQYYIFACSKKQKIDFEGGFFINKQMKETTSIPDSIPLKMRYYKYLSNKTYIEKTKKSLFVFNTPAVLNCHGWKLGEFLCMGKAIISTHLVNELPVPLEHGKHIYYVNGEQDIEEAVSLLLKDNDLKNRLEKNAKSYYENYASPSKVIERIINNVL
jgi:glycosyltransferase involved in cell wall biosynthesis